MEETKKEETKSFRPNIKITSKFLLLVEGKDEIEFFNTLFKYMSIDGVQILEVGGKNNFPHHIKSIKQDLGDDCSNITNLGIIRDADDNAKAAFDSICYHLNQNEIAPPKSIGIVENIDNRKIGIFIMPNNKDNGMLETLCLKSIESTCCYKEMNIYIECLQNLYKNNKSFNVDKAKSQVYLASKIPMKNRLGLGAEAGQWNFNHSAFTEIKTFLKELFT
ncbi:MAG: DUF3226 domain-containing protein [Treponema sp.]